MPSKPQFVGEKVRLGDVCTIVSGATPKTKTDEYWGGEIKWITPAELNGDSHYISDTEKHLTVAGYKSASLHMMPKGTVLLTTRAPIGKVAIATEEMCCNQGFKNLVCSAAINNEFLFLYLKSRKAELQAMGRGATFKELSKKNIAEFEINLPSIDCQLDAVAKLTAVGNQIACAKQQLEQLDSLVKSRFVEMFGDGVDAEIMALKDVCSIITDGTHQPPKFSIEGIPFLFVSNIAQNSIVYETNKYISEEDYECLIKRTPIEIGDILVSAVGSFGHPAVVKEEKPFCFQRHIAYLKPMHELIDSNYLHAALLSDDAQRYMNLCAKGVAQRTVTLKSFKEMRILVPPLALQQKFAAFVLQVDKSRFVYLGNERYEFLFYS